MSGIILVVAAGGKELLFNKTAHFDGKQHVELQLMSELFNRTAKKTHYYLEPAVMSFFMSTIPPARSASASSKGP
ncbi:MAG TPA: hypothetical protein VN493_26655 [Thermoanaerobaculia bacterium]|nr:hypothetical protein [Thermoanaerobaculia bacterium]